MKKKGKESLLLLLYLRSRRHLHSPTAATASASATAGLSSVSSQEQMGMDSPDRYSYNPKLKWNSVVEAYFVKAYGEHHFSRISKALTCPSTYSCIRVNALKSTTESVIDKLTSFLDEKRLNVDAGLIALDKNGGSPQVVSEYSVELPSDYSSQSPSGTFANGCTPSIYKCPLPGLDNVIFVKGSGPHIIEYAHELEQPMKEVIVSRKCAEAVLRGAQVFVPGVLACSSHVEIGDTVAVSVAVEQPDHDSSWSFGFTRGTVLNGTHTDPQYSERNGLYIGQGITMMSRAGIFRALKGVAVEMKNRVFDLPSFNDVLEGEIFLQNLPSIVTAHVLAPQQGERILDMCAAPGGKTTAIAILMKNIGEVVAVDRSHNKVLDILKLAAEMGLNCITAYKLDALKAVRKEDESIESALPHNSCNSVGLAKTLELTLQRSVDASTDSVDGNEKLIQGTSKPKGNTSKSSERLRNGPGRNNCTGARVEKSKGFLPDSFDRVLLDAPCSALGLRPRLFAGEVTMESLRNHGKYQRRMFDQAVRLVRPGGVIVYSTCTINPGENEALVRYALDTYKFLSLAQQLPKVGGPGLVGHCELPDGQYVEEWLRPGEEELVQRFDPSSSLDTIGFFIAKFDVGEKE